MKYLLAIYGTDELWESFPKDELEVAIAAQDAYNAKYLASGELLGAYGLGGPTDSKLVRNTGGQPVVTDGPYQETKEYLASFYLIDVPTAERAYQLAAEIPWAAQAPVEVLPVPHFAL